jgi:two-component system LytT family sensor kinase
MERFRMDIVGHIFSSKFPANRPAVSLSFFSYSFRVYAQINIFTSFSIVILAYAYRLLLALFMQQRISKELENQKLKAELSFLKMQINPHFLFNALNNIYSLTVIEKSKKAGDSILKLSEMMRYVLYEKEDEESKVSLDTEIKQLNNYIDLEKLRHASDLQLHFSIEGDTLGKRIAPLLLFPLLENAFKHGVLSDPEKPLLIHLKAGDKELHFSISNHINDYQKDQVGGIGIQNVHKRLELLYGNRYSFTVREEGNVFFADLKLPL